MTRDGIQVATTEYALKRDYSESKCNTTFIVKACNNHAALVEALRAAFPYVQHAHSNLTTLTKNPIEDDLNKIKAALKAVEKG